MDVLTGGHPANTPLRVALISPGDDAARETQTPAKGRFGDIFDALSSAGHHVEHAIYHDDFCDDVREQLLTVDVAMVWVNPVHEGRDRSVLDQMLREVAEAGVHVSADPEVVLLLGTKQVLHDTRDLSWGCNTELYRSAGELLAGLTNTVRAGPRVLKQHRGSSGDGVYRVELVDPADDTNETSLVRVRHAKRGSDDEVMSLQGFCGGFREYFGARPNGALMVDQQFQQRIVEGMVRCYLVRDRVQGFGLQATNALIPARAGEDAPEPGPRLYHPPDLVDYERLKSQLEEEWVPAVQRMFSLSTERLPLLWDCDFMLGAADADGRDTYVLCEINVSSVAPYPDSVVGAIVQAVAEFSR